MTNYVLSGGTSELGNRVVSLLTSGFGSGAITCVVRATSRTEPLKKLGVRTTLGDVTHPETLWSLLEPDTVYIDMTHPKHYHVSLEAVKAAGVRRAFFVTTTGVFSKYNHCAEIYRINEERIRNSGITYTILRPSLIYGTDRDRNMTKLLRMLDSWPVFPVFGSGEGLMQPVFVQDLAEGIATSIFRTETSRGKEYNLCGPRPLPYIELLRIANRTLGRRACLVRLPHGVAVAVTGMLERLPGFPIKREQVLRLLEDKSFDISLAEQDLDYRPRDFSEGILEEVQCLRAKGFLRGQ